MPFTDADPATEANAQRLSVVVAKCCGEERLEVYVAWAHTYDHEKSPRPTGETFESECAELLSRELFIYLDLCGSTGAGRMLQVAEDNLIDVMFITPSWRTGSRVARGHAANGLMHEVRFTDEADLVTSLRPALRQLSGRLEFRHSRWPSRNIPPGCARRIRIARERLGLTRDALAKDLGVHVELVRAIEEGTTVPSLYAMRVLAQVLRMLPGDLQEPGAVGSQKELEEGAIRAFWLAHNLPMGDYVEFQEALEDRGRDGAGAISDAEIRFLYELWLKDRNA